MSPKELREEFEKSYEDMKIVVELGGKLAKWAPVGISDYVEMVVDVYKGAEVAIKLAKQRAEGWEKELENIQKLEDKHTNKNSWQYQRNIYESNDVPNRTLVQQFKKRDIGQSK